MIDPWYFFRGCSYVSRQIGNSPKRQQRWRYVHSLNVFARFLMQCWRRGSDNGWCKLFLPQFRFEYSMLLILILILHWYNSIIDGMRAWKALVPAALEVLQGLGHIALVRLAAAIGGDGLRGGVLPGANSEEGNKWHAKRTHHYWANGFYWQVIRDTGVDVGHHIIGALPCAACIVGLALCHQNVWYISLLYLGQTLFGSLYSTMTCAPKVENKWFYSSAFPTKVSCFTMLWSWGAGLTLAFLAFLHRLDYSRIHDVGMLELREKLGMHRLAIGNRTIRHNTSRPDVRRTLWFGERRANKIVHNVATMQHKGEDRLWVGSGDRWWTSSAYKSFESLIRHSDISFILIDLAVLSRHYAMLTIDFMSTKFLKTSDHLSKLPRWILQLSGIGQCLLFLHRLSGWV